MPTRAQIETEIAYRARVALAVSEIAVDAVSDVSPRAYLNGPIRQALTALGFDVVDPFAVSDSDLELIAGSDLDDLIDAAELFTLETVLLNFDGIDTKATDLTESWSQYADRLIGIIARKRATLEERIGLDVARPEAGRIRLGSVESWTAGGEWA